jgi:hypothetical protein
LCVESQEKYSPTDPVHEERPAEYTPTSTDPTTYQTSSSSAANRPTDSVIYDTPSSQVVYPPTGPVAYENSSYTPIYGPAPVNPAPVDLAMFEIAEWTEGTSTSPALEDSHTINAAPGCTIDAASDRPMSLPPHSNDPQDNSLFAIPAEMTHNPGMPVQSLWNFVNPHDVFDMQPNAHGMDWFAHFPNVGLNATVQSPRSAPPEVGLGSTSSW